MFNNSAIDVCLGLVFIFLLYSLMATIIQEIIAKWFSLRARNLLKAMRRMLEDQKEAKAWTAVNVFIDFGYAFKNYFLPYSNHPFLEAFYQSASIKYLAENRGNSRPSYISPNNFSETVIHLLQGDNFTHAQNPMSLIRDNLTTNKIQNFSISAETLSYIKKLYVDANGDIDKFRANLEVWFQAVMDRSIGWYKRQTQTLLFFIGLGIAISFNIDTVAIAKILINNKTAREELANFAVAHAGDYGHAISDTASDSQKKQVESMKKDAQNVQNILGLGHDATVKTDTACQAGFKAHLQKLSAKKTIGTAEIKTLEAEFKKCEVKESNTQGSYGSHLIGWLLTALAISLGAPFWFDLLNKIISLRGTGTREKSDDETTKSADAAVKRVG